MRLIQHNTCFNNKRDLQWDTIIQNRLRFKQFHWLILLTWIRKEARTVWRSSIRKQWALLLEGVCWYFYSVVLLLPPSREIIARGSQTEKGETTEEWGQKCSTKLGYSAEFLSTIEPQKNYGMRRVEEAWLWLIGVSVRFVWTWGRG